MGLSELQILPEIEGLTALYAAELPQKDELCGAFWAALALREAGVHDCVGDSIDQDAVALAAGTSLSNEQGASLPPGETGRRDYRLRIPTIADPVRSGTSAAGLVRAVRELSQRRLAAVPIAGPWTESTVLSLFGVAAAAPRARLIANVATRHLWGARPGPAAVLGHLMRGTLEGPPPDWDVGHFVLLAGAVRGEAGGLVVVADTYRSLGIEGIHLQPAACVAAALERPDVPTSGGVLIVVDARDVDAVVAAAREVGLENHLWDNGTPDREGDVDG